VVTAKELVPMQDGSAPSDDLIRNRGRIAAHRG
jgi:hypothetical protein